MESGIIIHLLGIVVASVSLSGVGINAILLGDTLSDWRHLRNIPETSPVQLIGIAHIREESARVFMQVVSFVCGLVAISLSQPLEADILYWVLLSEFAFVAISLSTASLGFLDYRDRQKLFGMMVQEITTSRHAATGLVVAEPDRPS